MTSTIKLYGIKNCDTVKKARDWLTQQGIDYQFNDFRADGISPELVESWIHQLGLDLLVNKRSTTWKELDEQIKASFGEATAINVIMAHPTLIKRPVLDTGSRLLVGFKAADYQTALK